MTNLLITGTYRSGTTLLEKLLTNHDTGIVFSQPFPLLFVKIKEQFEKNRKESVFPYAINPEFDVHFDSEQFTTFLSNFIIDEKLINETLSLMKGYSGCGTPEIQKIQNCRFTERLIDFYKNYTDKLTDFYRIENKSFTGSKEIILEDYIPYFLKEKLKVLLIIRDPRDIIVSSNFMNNEGFTGKPRPILYTLQMWRKSVAYALKFKDEPNILVLKYEDLVNNPYVKLNEITSFLGVKPFSQTEFKQGIKDQYGMLWKGNSSFDSFNFIDKSSIGRYKEKLPTNVIDYINSVCAPELSVMDYKVNIEFDEKKISGFKEPDYEINPAFVKNYSSSKKAIEKELYRWQLLNTDNSQTDTVKSYFIFEQTYRVLKQTLNLTS